MARAAITIPLFITADDNAKRNAVKWGGLWRVYRTPNGNYQSLGGSARPVEHSAMLHAYVHQIGRGFTRYLPEDIPANHWYPKD